MSKTLLIVDDSDTVREMLVVSFAGAGFATLQARDGLEALEMLRIDTPDLVITDINMPNMGGIALIEAIRAGGARANMPIIAISSQAAAFEARVRKAGADVVLMKPFDRSSIVEAARRLTSSGV